jgi:outer membrane lipoprotein-sorting protein
MTRDDRDLHTLFHAAAPPARPVDVDALFAAAGRRADSTETSRSPWKRSVSMSLRITAGVLVAASVAGVATLLVPRESAANVSLAEVQATVNKTQTMTCKCFEQKVPPAKQADGPGRILIRGPNIVRFEQADGSYTVTDFSRHKSLLVDPAKKSARVLEGFTPPGGVQIQSFYDLFRSIASRPVKTLPPRLIGGKMCVGFVVRNPMEGAPGLPQSPKAEITVWVDPETKLPLRIDTVTREDGVTSTQIMSGIVFDRPLDPALFVLTPPEGYKVETFGVAELQPDPAVKDKAAAELVATPLVGLGEVKFGMKPDDVIRLLGKPDKIESPNKGYTILEYYSRGFSIHTTTPRGVMMITCFTGKFWAFKVRDFAGRTDKGIKMGATRADIEKAYGKPSSVHEATFKDMFGDRTAKPDKKTGQVDLTYAGLQLSFSLHDDALDSIMINGPRPAAAAKEKPAKK